MGYERNDRRFGGSNDRSGYGGYGPERRFDSRDYRRDDDRARVYGGDHSRRENTGPQSEEYRERARWDNRDDTGDRGFFDRASDEVRSWFGDDDAERRRQQDEREAERDYRRRYGASHARSASDYYGYYGDPGFGPGIGAPGADYGTVYDAGRRDRDPGRFDHGYRSWRDRQMESFDRDYDEYRREHQGKFDNEFAQWRTQRAGQRDLLSQVQEHQDVVGSDGTHIGKVDHVRGDRIVLTKSDQTASGHHHSIPSSWIRSVTDKITVAKTADEAKRHWRDEERGQSAFGWRDDEDRGGTNLNRSFSGTY